MLLLIVWASGGVFQSCRQLKMREIYIMRSMGRNFLGEIFYQSDISCSLLVRCRLGSLSFFILGVHSSIIAYSVIQIQHIEPASNAVYGQFRDSLEIKISIALGSCYGDNINTSHRHTRCFTYYILTMRLPSTYLFVSRKVLSNGHLCSSVQQSSPFACVPYMNEAFA